MPFKCDFCQRLFKHKRSRDRHVKLHTGDKKYRCPHCESAFSRSDHLKIHMKTHDHQKPFQCVICNRGYNTAAALTSHMQNHKKESLDNSPSPGPFRCLQCTGTFSTGEELQTHVSHHHRPISSSSPEKTDSSASNKRRSASPKTPSSPSNRARHSDLDHASPRLMIPFPIPKLACIYCTKDSFTTMESLQLHVQAMHGPLLNGDLAELSNHISPIGTPTGIPTPDSLSSMGPFTCTFCTMKFSSLSALHKHAMSVHSLSGYLQAKAKENSFCAQCAIAFPNSLAYVEHVLLFHANPNRTRKLMQVCSPEPPQVKPTDLSKKSKGESGNASVTSSGSSIPTKKSKRDDDENLSQHAFSSPISSLLNNTPLGLGPHSLLCNQCNAGFRDFESFRTHLKSHLEEVVHKFVCEECDSEFSTEDQLENHAMAHYLTTTTEYGCQSCLKLFGKPDELQKHLMDIHAHHLYRCSLCKEMFDSKVSIQVHFAVKHSNECKLFRCIRCNSCTTVFRSEFEFQVHVKMAHLRKISPYRCLLCSASFVSELELQFHLSTHQKQFRCKLCDEAFHVEFLLDKHMQSHHASVLNGEPDTTTHSPTGNTGGSVTSLKGTKKSNHGSSSHKVKELKCDICDLSMGSESELTTHRKQVHHIPPTSINSSSTSQQQLSGGDIRSPSTDSSSGHLLNPNSVGSKSGQKPVVGNSSGGGHHALSLHCAYCNENCKSRSDLENHMKTHQIVSTGKHKCNICDEVCPTATMLAEHKLTHCKVISGNTCATCKVSITSEESFYQHMKQHAGGLSTTGSSSSSAGGASAGGNNNNSNGSSSTATNSASAATPLPTNCVVCRQTLITDIEIQLHARFHTKHSDIGTLNLASPTSSAAASLGLAALSSGLSTALLNNNTLTSLTNPLGLIGSTCSSSVTSSSASLQCVMCLRTDEKPSSSFLLNGVTNGVQNYVCQDCYAKTSISLTPPANSSPKKYVKSLDSPSGGEENLNQNTVISTPSSNNHHNSSGNRDKINPSSAAISPSSSFPPICRLGSSSNSSNSSRSSSASTPTNPSSATVLPVNGSPSAATRRCYQCIKCQMSFASEQQVQAHVTTHLMNEGSNHECHLCNHVFFDSPLKLQVHLIEHTFEGCSAFTCYMCSSTWTSAKKLQEHMVEHGLHSRPYDCNQCHLKFFFRAELENHIFTHEDIKKSIIETSIISTSPFSATTPPTSANTTGTNLVLNDHHLHSTIKSPILNLSQEALDYRQALLSASQQAIATLHHQHTPKSPPSHHKRNSSSNKSYRKPKKFFYRSDDSDEEMESISIKKESPDMDEDIDPHISTLLPNGKSSEAHLSSEESSDSKIKTSPILPSSRTELDRFEGAGRESLSVT